MLDTGVNLAHPDLKDRIVPGFNVQDNNTDTSDLCGHGTAVAGTNNALGVAGRDPVFGHGRVDAAAAVGAARTWVNPVDTTAPTASIAAPLGSSSVSGSVPVSVNALDNIGVARVDLKVNGTVVATDSAAPYSFSWNSAGSPNGMAALVAVAYDAAGNAGAAGIRTRLSIDGVLKAAGTGGSLSYSWNTRKERAGTHTVSVTARGAIFL